MLPNWRMLPTRTNLYSCLSWVPGRIVLWLMFQTGERGLWTRLPAYSNWATDIFGLFIAEIDLHSCLCSKSGRLVLGGMRVAYDSAIPFRFEQYSRWPECNLFVPIPQISLASCISWITLWIIDAGLCLPVKTDIWDTIETSTFLHLPSKNLGFISIPDSVAFLCYVEDTTHIGRFAVNFGIKSNLRGIDVHYSSRWWNRIPGYRSANTPQIVRSDVHYFRRRNAGRVGRLLFDFVNALWGVFDPRWNAMMETWSLEYAVWIQRRDNWISQSISLTGIFNKAISEHVFLQ
jgi:hypothetical protein